MWVTASSVWSRLYREKCGKRAAHRKFFTSVPLRDFSQLFALKYKTLNLRLQILIGQSYETYMSVVSAFCSKSNFISFLYQKLPGKKQNKTIKRTFLVVAPPAGRVRLCSFDMKIQWWLSGWANWFNKKEKPEGGEQTWQSFGSLWLDDALNKGY